jgi:broad specificity phosphatase PhoE
LLLGQRDVPLSAKGQRQLPRLMQKISPYRAQAVYSSDLLRARATAAPISRRLGVEVNVLPGLREIHFGRWQGLSWAEVAKRFPQAARRWLKDFPRQPIPGGEDLQKFKTRVRHELRKIVAAHPGGSAIVVTHGGVIRTTLASALGMPDRYLFRIAQDSGAVSVIDYFPGGAIVRCMNG